MAIKRQVNFLGNMRVDVPHLRMLESAVAADFQALSGTFMSGSTALVASGVHILDTGMVGQPANTLILRMANATLLHGTATEPGAIYTVSSAQPDDTLDVANAAVVGSFVPNVTNYIALDLVRTADPTTQDTAMFRSSSTTGLEFPQVVPLGRVLNYVINISTSNFGATPTLCPVAKVVTDANNNIVSITDCRQMFFRLGSGGTSPDPLAQYVWGNRNETTSTSLFTGGDKDITSQYAFNGAILQRLWELGGGERWYSPADDRSVKLTYATAQPWAWDGTDLTWSGLTFAFGNSTAETNVVVDQPAAGGGVQPSGYLNLTTLLDGDVIYVDLDRANDGVNIQPHRAHRTWLFLNPPAIPGTRQILAWRVGAQVFAGDDNVDVTVTVPLPIATNVINGGVRLNHGSPTPLDPTVPVCNAANWAVADGLDRALPGALSIGVNVATSLVFAQAGVTSTFDGELDTTNGLVATTAVANGAAITATGTGTGAGVSGQGGSTTLAQSGNGIYGKGGAATLLAGPAAGYGVYGKGGTSQSPFHGSVGYGGYFEGGEYLSDPTIGGIGVYGKGFGTGTAGYFAGGVTNGTGVFGQGGVGASGLGGQFYAGDGGLAGVEALGSATLRAGTISCGISANGGPGGGDGGRFVGTGGGVGIKGTGGATSATAHGVHGVAGATAFAAGVYGEGGSGADAHGVKGLGRFTGNGGNFEGGSTAGAAGVYGKGSSAVTGGSGVYGLGTALYHGIEGVGGADGYGGYFSGGTNRAPLHLVSRSQPSIANSAGGDIYFDSTEKAPYFYNSSLGTWHQMGSHTVMLSADQTTTSNTPANVTGFVFPVVAGGKYAFTVHFIFSTAAAAGVSVDFLAVGGAAVGATGAVQIGSQLIAATSAYGWGAAALGTSFTIINTTLGVDANCIIDGSIILSGAGAASGTVQMRWWSMNNTFLSTLKAGSFISWKRVD